MAIFDYVWLDGYPDVKNLRSKTAVADDLLANDFWRLDNIPEWGFDGSSTKQADGGSSDCKLKPVLHCCNPFRSNHKQAFIVLCEVMNTDNSPHKTNTRAKMMKTYEKYKDNEMWFAFEQEYTLFDGAGKMPYKWPTNGFPSPQGRYYCGIGADAAWGREISDEHLDMCLEANIPIVGTNAEVMPGQWEFQTGPLTANKAADYLWLSRYILNRVAEKHNITIKLDPKPIIEGDWNGSGCHTNFSTKKMRENCGPDEWTHICECLREQTPEHIGVYGNKNEERLTGFHETQHINEFSFGIADRGASIRIPPKMAHDHRGYLEDRRPAANIDPYEVCTVLLETVCGMANEGKVNEPAIVQV